MKLNILTCFVAAFLLVFAACKSDTKTPEAAAVPAVSEIEKKEVIAIDSATLQVKQTEAEIENQTKSAEDALKALDE